MHPSKNNIRAHDTLFEELKDVARGVRPAPADAAARSFESEAVRDERQEAAVTLKRPGQCTEEELAVFQRLVLEGGEVTEHGLDQRVRAAHLLAFAQDGETVVGVGALKQPMDDRRRRIFRKAGLELPENLRFELGWISVAQAHQGQRWSRALVAKLTRAIDEGVYATSRTDKAAMHRSLQRFGFERVGKAYPSTEHKGREIAVFVRM